METVYYFQMCLRKDLMHQIQNAQWSMFSFSFFCFCLILRDRNIKVEIVISLQIYIQCCTYNMYGCIYI